MGAPVIGFKPAARSKARRIAPYVIVLLIAAYLYYVANQFEFMARTGHLGPDFWPKAMLILMMVACAYEIIKQALAKGEQTDVGSVLDELIEESTIEHPEAAATERETFAVEEEKTYPQLLAIGIGLTIAYVLLFDILGFFLDTFLFLAFFMYVGRYRRVGVILATSLIGSLAYMFVFMKIVYVSLPIGKAPFSAVSLWLMKIMGVS
jgi:putative tricarboxylic transport membrane protein